MATSLPPGGYLFGAADGEAPEIKEMKVVMTGNNAGKTASLLDLLKKEMEKNAGFPSSLYDQYTGKPYYSDTTIDRTLRGWRPMCELCRRPVEQMQTYRSEECRALLVRLVCHGRAFEFKIDDYEPQMRPDRGMDIIRRYCSEATLKDRMEAQIAYGQDGRVEAISFPNKQSFNLSRIGGELMFDETDAYRVMQEKMMSRQMQQAMGMFTSGSTASSSPPPARKPTKAELLKMLAEYEKSERPEIPLDAERVITL